MTTAEFLAAPYFGGSGGTQARATIGGIHDALAACGFVRTADTGQLDPLTVTRPAATTGTLGFEVWRFDDDLQVTHPIVFRIDYLYGSNGSVGMSVTVGRGSDGAGAITGVLAAPAAMTQSSATSAAPAVPGYVSSGDGSMCAVFAWAGPITGATPPCGFLIDRSRGHDGAPTGDGVTVAVRSTGVVAGAADSSGNSGTSVRDAALYCVAYDSGAAAVGTIPVAVPFWLDGVPLDGGVGVGGGVLAPVFPWACFVPGEAPWQALAGISYAGSDATSGVMTVRIQGADRQYRFIPLAASATWGVALNPLTNLANSVNALSRAVGIAILWE